MNLRLALYELAETHRLDAAATAELERLAGLEGEPPGALDLVRRGLALTAALLVGLGVILWVAANWSELGRVGRFALLQAFFVVMAAGAWLRPSLREALGLLAFLIIGGLFAYFGQTYQTGADPWQLFALWAALGLPLVLAVRRDALWMPWTLVAMSGIALWAHAHAGHRWRFSAGDFWVMGVAWALATLLVIGLAGPLRRFGAGVWALRTALLLLVILVTLHAVVGLFASSVEPLYPLGLSVLCIVIGVCGVAREFEIFGVSVATLGLNVLLDAGLARWLFLDHGEAQSVGNFLLLGLAAAVLLGLSVRLVLCLARRRAAVEGRA